MKSLILFSAVTLFAMSAFAAEGQQVSYKSGDETVQGMLYHAERQRPFSRADRDS
jgi:hypothetical protein